VPSQRCGLGIDVPERSADDGDCLPARVDRRGVGSGVDTFGKARHDRKGVVHEPTREVTCPRKAVLCRLSGANDGD
jgi:hypothetical protein